MGDLQHRLDVLVLDYLLSKRGLTTEWTLKLGELLPPGTVETLAGAPQARLMLRLLLDNHNISEDTTTCLGMLKNVEGDRSDMFGPVTGVAPEAELLTEVPATKQSP